MFEKFYKYLLIKGFNETYAKELISKMERGIAEDKEYNLEKNTVVLTTKADLPIILDEAESVLPSGSHITLTATDGESYVKFTIQETGQCGTLQLQRGTGESYAVYINGMNENDCFEFLPYAG